MLRLRSSFLLLAALLCLSLLSVHVVGDEAAAAAAGGNEDHAAKLAAAQRRLPFGDIEAMKERFQHLRNSGSPLLNMPALAAMLGGQGAPAPAGVGAAAAPTQAAPARAAAARAAPHATPVPAAAAPAATTAQAADPLSHPAMPDALRASFERMQAMRREHAARTGAPADASSDDIAMPGLPGLANLAGMHERLRRQQSEQQQQPQPQQQQQRHAAAAASAHSASAPIPADHPANVHERMRQIREKLEERLGKHGVPGALPLFGGLPNMMPPAAAAPAEAQQPAAPNTDL